MLDAPEQLTVVRELGELDLDERPRRAEPAHQLRQDAGPDRLVDAHAQHACGALGERCEVGLRRRQPRDDRLRVPEQQAAGLGQRDRLRSPRPLDQALADDPLEHRDLLAHGGLRVAEARRSAAERALARDGLEGDQMPQFDPQPAIRFHNRSQS